MTNEKLIVSAVTAVPIFPLRIERRYAAVKLRLRESCCPIADGTIVVVVAVVVHHLFIASANPEPLTTSPPDKPEPKGFRRLSPLGRDEELKPIDESLRRVGLDVEDDGTGSCFADFTRFGKTHLFALIEGPVEMPVRTQVILARRCFCLGKVGRIVMLSG